MKKIAVIGCGWVGTQHAESIRNLDNLELCAACDVNLPLARKMTDEYGGRPFEDLNKLIDESRPEIVVVGTPPYLHEAVIETILQGGVKKIVCEKPLGHTLTSAKIIAEAAQKAGARLMTAFCHRFIEPVIKTRRWIMEGRLGEIVLFRNEFSTMFTGVADRWFSQKKISGGGCMMDTSIHSADLFRFLCGEAENVSARLSAKMPGLDVEDSSCIMLQTAQGAAGIIEASWNAAGGRACWEVVGTKGRAEYHYWKSFRALLDGDKEWRDVTVERDINLRFQDELAAFVASLDDPAVSVPGAEDGVKANAIIDAAYRCVEEKSWIKL